MVRRTVAVARDLRTSLTGGLCGEALQRGAEIAFAQPLEGAVAQLAYALTRHTQHVADLFERVLASAVEAEVQPHDTRIARRQRVERAVDLLREQPLLYSLLRLLRLVGHEALDELAVVAVADRRIETDLGGVQRLERSNDFRRERGGGRNFLDARIAAELLLEPLPLAEDACEIARAIQRHAHRAALIGERGENRLADPPHRVLDELHALVDVELPRGSDQTDVAFLDQIDQGDAAVLILFRNTDHETQVGTDEPLDRVLVAFTRTTTQLDLLLGRQQLVTADFPQVLIERAPLFGRTGETLEPRGGPPTPTLAVLCRA